MTASFDAGISENDAQQFASDTEGTKSIEETTADAGAGDTVDDGSPERFEFLAKSLGFVLKTPFEIAARKTKDDEWLLTEEQLEGLRELAVPVATKWIEKISAWVGAPADSSTSPEVALAIGITGIAAIKFLQTQEKRFTKPASMPASGKTEKSEAGSSSSGNQAAEKASILRVPLPDYGELDASIR